jgi:predicted ATPase/transcriptional regulator with XRE-family HTH domain
MGATEPGTFGVLLHRHRTEAGLTQDELAERAAVSVRAVSDLERGVTRAPQRHTIQQLAIALGLADEDRVRFQESGRRRTLGGSRPRVHGSTSPPTNLMDEPTPFIGREPETAEIAALLLQPTVRLVTLTGTGGTGKTRLALRVAQQILVQFEDGVFFVSLGSIGDPKLVPSAIAATVGVNERKSQALVDVLQEHFRGRHLLLLLDNLEHLIDASDVVAALLDACPRLSILVTSRFLLHLSREHEYPVPPLSVPDIKHLPSFEALFRYDAMALFVQQAQSARPSFTLTPQNAVAVAAICSRLDGLPLAIELAAARIRVFPPQALLVRLSNRLELLSGGARDLPARQQTLRATIDWSYELVSGAEQTVLARLSVFAGGCTLEAAEAVCHAAGTLSLDALQGITGLIEKNLLRQDGGADGECRFVMLETIREYATEKLTLSGEERQSRDAHAKYFLAMAREAAATRHGPGLGGVLEYLERDLDNIRNALIWSRDYGEPAAGLEMATALGGFWIGRGHVAEGIDWLTTFLKICPESGDLRGVALNDASYLSSIHGNYEGAHRFAAENVRIARERGDPEQIARALASLPRLMLVDRNIDGILQVTQEGIALAHRTGDTDLLALHLLSRAEGMRIAHNYAEARSLYVESLELSRGLGDAAMIASNLHNLIEVELDEGKLDRAAELAVEKVTIALQLRHVWIDCYTLLDCARLAAARENFLGAAQLLAAATQMFQSTGVLIASPERAGYDSTLSLLREELEDDEFASLWEEGQAMSPEEALTCASKVAHSGGRSTSG